MCFVVLAYDCHPDYLLVLAANRDEYHSRPTAPAHFWEDAPGVLAGKDLEHCGTWLGVSRPGRLAALTNYRDPSSHRPGTPSRGALVRDYLSSSFDPVSYLNKLNNCRGEYNGYNLLLMDGGIMWHYSNRTGKPLKITPGIHGLSNHLLDTPWPKVEKGKAALGRIIKYSGDTLVEGLFELLSDSEMASDKSLPQTGVTLEWERLLSPVFIQNELYGTRSSTVIMVKRSGQILFRERSFYCDGRPMGSDINYII
ncbi:MAG: NRDE family protein [Bacillota bacterium]